MIAPIAAPKDISIKLASLIFPILPRLKASGFRNAEIATNTAADQLNYEILQQVLALRSLTLNAINAPIDPPITKNIKT